MTSPSVILSAAASQKTWLLCTCLMIRAPNEMRWKGYINDLARISSLTSLLFLDISIKKLCFSCLTATSKCSTMNRGVRVRVCVTHSVCTNSEGICQGKKIATGAFCKSLYGFIQYVLCCLSLCRNLKTNCERPLPSWRRPKKRQNRSARTARTWSEHTRFVVFLTKKY